jgi:hypothetical protein
MYREALDQLPIAERNIAQRAGRQLFVDLQIAGASSQKYPEYQEFFLLARLPRVYMS